MKNKMTFERRVFFTGMLPNALSAAFIYLYSTFIMQVDSNVMLQCLIVFLILFFPAQFLVAPLTNKMISRSITARIIKFEKDELSAEEKAVVKAEMKEALEGLAGKIPGLLEVKVYTEGLASSKNAEVMLDTTFTDEEALKGYAVHLEHVAVADGWVRPNVETRMAFDFEV